MNTEWLDGEEFAQAMYAYRCAPITNQAQVIRAFEEVKQFFRAQIAAIELDRGIERDLSE